MQEQAIQEIELIKNFRPEAKILLTDNINNKVNIAINSDGFRIADILDQLLPDETLIFAVNDGYEVDAIGKTYINKRYQGSIFWPNELHGIFVRITSDMGSIKKWGGRLTKEFCITPKEEETTDGLFSTIVEDIARINKLDGRSIPVRFVKYNEEFGEFSAEVIKMIGCTQKPYDEDHLIEESADALQCLISIQLDVCEKQGIDFNKVLKTILEKNKKWEAKIKEYTNRS